MSFSKGLCILLLITAMVLLFCVSASSAASDETQVNKTDSTSAVGQGASGESAIPNLVGVWDVESEGTALYKSGGPGEYTHYKEGYNTLLGRAEITEQTGRVLQGIFSAPMGEDEKFIGVIHVDNRILRIADMDGTYDGQIIDNNTIKMLYRHTTDVDSVVDVGTWTRVKEESNQ